MSTLYFIDRYLTEDKNFIKKTTLSNKEDFYKVLKWWLKLSNSETIADTTKYNGNTRIIDLKIGSITYYMHADTNKIGVKRFLANKDNDWKIIPSQKGNLNRVTNDSNQKDIKGLYLYKDIWK